MSLDLVLYAAGVICLASTLGFMAFVWTDLRMQDRAEQRRREQRAMPNEFRRPL